MASLFVKKELTDKEYIVKYSLIYLGMKRIKDAAVENIMNEQE